MALETHHNTEDGGVGRRPVSLTIPCQAEYMGLCRLMAGAVGAREALGQEDIADLKLVVTEACTCFLLGLDGGAGEKPQDSADQSPSELRVDYDVRPEAWAVAVSDPACRHRIPGESLSEPSGAAGLGLMIIRALADTVEHTYSDSEGSVIKLVKHLTPQAADSL